MALLTDQWTPTNYKDTARQRIYLKDIDCPPVWFEKLRNLLPPFLCYLNESTANTKTGVGKAGDLMSSLPPDMRAENLMCYIGHEGTYTPSHREMCATLGHNIMVETSTGAVEDGKIAKPGSSIWFMTESKDRHLVSEYWRSRLGHDIEIEDHFAQINAWKLAPFKTYIVEQKVGDFILIPPLAPHQVWNRGTRTMKVAWNRTTVETLEMALNEALPKARMVCRDEQYKNKAIIYYTLMKYSDLLQRSDPRGNPKVRQIQKDFRRLFLLYTQILCSESFSRDHPEPKNVEYIPFSSNVLCSYCRCNIFNRFLTCPSCIGKLPDGDDDNYDVCMECYSIGRSCACVSKLKWAEQFRWKELLKNHEIWRNQILQFRNRPVNTEEPLEPFMVERERLGKKTLAEICQEELKRRPWTDITNPAVREENEEEIVEVNDDGRVRKRRKIRRSKKFQKQHGSCHICKTPEAKWKLAVCGDCGVNYCYGSLYRAFDISPREVMEEISWKCPKCRKICSCGACRRDPTMNPYEPTGTLLGHDTRKVADPRSVEGLVDFSQSNMTWIIKAGDHSEDLTETRRLRKRLEEAEMAKQHDPVLEDHDLDHEDTDIPPSSTNNPNILDPSLIKENGRSHLEVRHDNGFAIDPALTADLLGGGSSNFVVPSNAVFREEMADRYEATEGITFEYSDSEATSAFFNVHQNTIISGAGNETPNGQHDLDPHMEPRFGLDGAGDTVSSAILQSDLLPVDPTMISSPHSRKLSRALQTAEDEDFMPDPQSLQNIQASGAGIVTRRNKARVKYTEEPIVLSDQDELEDQSVATTHHISRKEVEPVSQRVQDAVTETSASDDNSATSTDKSNTDSNLFYAKEALELSVSSPGPSSSTSSADSVTSSPSEEERKPITHAEKNRKAKLMAMQWAQGNTDDIDSDEWI